jgi:hypothetical protein
VLSPASLAPPSIVHGAMVRLTCIRTGNSRARQSVGGLVPPAAAAATAWPLPHREGGVDEPFWMTQPGRASLSARHGALRTTDGTKWACGPVSFGGLRRHMADDACSRPPSRRRWQVLGPNRSHQGVTSHANLRGGSYGTHVVGWRAEANTPKFRGGPAPPWAGISSLRQPPTLRGDLTYDARVPGSGLP